nr:MAG TPA: putative polysaccharide binding protein [Caudoviricetes sp.]
MPNTYNPSGTSITDYSSIKFIPGDIINSSYSGAVNPVKLPAGNYQLECWGA